MKSTLNCIDIYIKLRSVKKWSIIQKMRINIISIGYSLYFFKIKKLSEEKHTH